MKKLFFGFVFFLIFGLCSSLFGDLVTTKKGKEIFGKLEYKSKSIRIKTNRGHKNLKWKDIEAILEFPPHSIYTEEEQAKIKKTYQKKLKKALQEKSEVLFFQLGIWCQKKDLKKEALLAFKNAIKIDPEHTGSRKRLGFVPENDGWTHRNILFKDKWQNTKGKSDGKFYSLARWCDRWKMYKQEEDVIRILLRKNQYNRKAIKVFRRLTKKYIPKRAYIFPLKGRYKISADRSRHHQLKCFAIWAYDIVKLDDQGRSSSGRSKNSDYYIWSEPIYSVGDGVVVHITQNFKDNRPGTGARFDKVNKILVDHGGGEYSFYCHIQQNSAVVKVGDKVKQGQMICLVGNSGASGLPHLHFTMMDKDYFSMPVWMKNYEMEQGSEKIFLQIAHPQEGWIVRSKFQNYFKSPKK